MNSKIFAVAAAVVLFGAIPHAQAGWELWETDESAGRLGANLQMMSAYVDLGGLSEVADVAGFPTEAGLAGAVGRLEWSAEFSDWLTLDVHNRLVWQSSTLPEELLFQGFEVSRGDDRRFSTEYDLLENDTLRLTHDLDRLVVGLYFDLFDVYLGRQAIRWGVSEMFTVADRFAPLSPFELDTLQRRGIDAARVVSHITPDVEVEMVVADRGEDEPLTIAGRAEYFGVNFDAYGGFGRFWNRLSAMGGVSYLSGYWKFYGEGEALFNLDESELDRPRATAGAQRVAADWVIGLEYHYNGFGVNPGDDYAQAFGSDELARGETYFLGRHYAGLNGGYFHESGWGFAGGAILNVVDPGVVIFPSVQYEVEDRFSVSAGAYVGFGESAELDLSGAQPDAEFEDVISIPSEFGAASDLYFLQMTAFF